ncbi:efflux RND transporter permease subunit [Candidatus Binatia bacterium]|nr:efflux RND transporter permease subunit [Candidatus Binatia bacterium]
MKTAVAWFARNNVAANLLMMVLVVGGLMALPSIPQKTFPDIDIDMVSVAVEYLGAAPEEVEEGVCVRIEEQIDGIDGIDRIRSTAAEGACAVIAEVLAGSDVDRVFTDIKNRVDAINTFPTETEKPIVARVTIRRPVSDIALYGPADERSLRAIAERIRDELAAHPAITQVDVVLARPFEISIEISEEALRRHGITFDHVAAAVRRSSLDLPGGTIETAGGEILLRAKGQAYRGPDFEDIIVLTRADGTRVTLGDVATVVDGFADTSVSGRFDGKPALLIQVFRVGQQDVIEIAEAVKEYVATAQPRLPEGVSLTVWQDDSVPLRGRLETLLSNARSGFILVFIVLTLFLHTRLAAWVTLGVPISFLGALALFNPLGISINVISLFAFIVVLGILVDDATVVGESVHTWQEKLGNNLEGAVIGTQQVTVPVVFGVLTTVATFVPMVVLPGPMGQVFAVAGIVSIACLVCSLIESQFVLPAHLGHAHPHRGPRTRVGRAWVGLQDRCSDGLIAFAHKVYRPVLVLAQEWRYTTIAIAMVLLLLAFTVVASGRMHFSFFPPIEADYLSARLTMPPGTTAEVTQAAVDRIAAAVGPLRQEIDAAHARPGASLFKNVLTAVGAQPLKDRQDNNPAAVQGIGEVRGNVAEVVIGLVPSEERDISTGEIGQRWRDLVGAVPGATELGYASDLFSAGNAIDIELAGTDIDELAQAARRVKDELARYPGVVDIADSFRAGKREIKLGIRPSAELLGLTLQDLARQVRQAFYGQEAQRIQRGRDDIRVMVRYPERDRTSIGDLENLRVRAPDGTEVPFSTVATVDLGRGYSTIRRTDRKRVVNVTADVDRAVTTANEVLEDMTGEKLPRILADYPSVSYDLEGEQREQTRALSGLLGAYVLALFAVYALLAIPLGSYTQPFIIMSVIPFGIVGAIGGHLLMGRHLSMMSVIGIVALSGVVVNASLVLVHFVNEARSEGVTVHDAITEAGVARFRPIVLTSLTTFVGLLPLMTEQSVQAQFLIPMAISLGYGVLFATLITLLVVPCGYLVLEDIGRFLARISGRRADRVPSAAPGLPPAATPAIDRGHTT